MLTDFLLNIVADPNELIKLKKNLSHSLANKKLSKADRKAIKKGDLHKLRALVRQEILRMKPKKSSSQQYFSSDYTVSTSGDTPHCPVNMSGSFHNSFWNVMKPDPMWDSRGLTIVGTGIRAGLQTTPESLICIQHAKKVLFLVADTLSKAWIQKLNPTAESMQGLYKKGKHRLEIYNAIVNKILSNLKKYKGVCVVFYGHPGHFVYPAHEAIRLAREQGFKARMLPGVSAEANLFADLGVDPGIAGVQSYEATNFVINRYRFDTSTGLVLWQVGLFGYAYWDPKYKANPKRLKVLVDCLREHYDSNHQVILYEASEYPLGNATVQRLPLSKLAHAKISGVATLYVPPKSLPAVDLDLARKLGIPDGRDE